MVAEVSANLSTETKSKCQHRCARGAVPLRGFTPPMLSCVLALLHRASTLTFTLDGDERFRSDDSLDDSLGDSLDDSLDDSLRSITIIYRKFIDTAKSWNPATVGK